MPRQGYTSITLSKSVYAEIQTFIDEYNKKVGFKRFRSISHFAEEAIAKYLKQKDLERGETS